MNYESRIKIKEESEELFLSGRFRLIFYVDNWPLFYSDWRDEPFLRKELLEFKKKYIVNESGYLTRDCCLSIDKELYLIRKEELKL